MKTASLLGALLLCAACPASALATSRQRALTYRNRERQQRDRVLT